MTAVDLLADLRFHDVRLWRDGDRLHVDAPAELATAELRQSVAQHKAEILEQLDLEQSLPILETRILVRTRAGVEVVQVAQVSPPGPIRWEKRLMRGAVALVGEVTTDQSVARMWAEVLQAADSGDTGATLPLGEMK